eukprot:s2515_g9.t1
MQFNDASLKLESCQCVDRAAQQTRLRNRLDVRDKNSVPTQRMRELEQQHWEKVQNAESRRTFYRTPVCSAMLACELCDFDCDDRSAFWKHLQEEYLTVDADGTPHEQVRCEEEYRKRMVYHEEHFGPFAVPGEQTRRGAASYSFHRTHSRKGTSAEERRLHSCAVCARIAWLEDMDRLKLFVESQQGDAEDVLAAVSPQEGDADEVSSDDNASAADSQKSKHGWKIHEVSKKKVGCLYKKVFDVRRYQKLWPSIAANEVFGSSISHFSGCYEDGTPWQWLDR